MILALPIRHNVHANLQPPIDEDMQKADQDDREEMENGRTRGNMRRLQAIVPKAGNNIF